MSSIRSRAPNASTEAVRCVMQANVGRETKAELVLRRALFVKGLRYRKDACPDAALRCFADIVFPRQKVCIFVDGCFWHRCPAHFVLPRTHSAWWDEKIAANVERDKRQTAWLRSRGWEVLRVWEHELSAVSIDPIVGLICKTVGEQANDTTIHRSNAIRRGV